MTPIAGDADAPPYAPTIAGMERWMAARFAQQVRIVDDAGEAGFEAVRHGAEAIARGLIAAGLTKGSRVGLLMPNGRAFVEVLTGVLTAGGQVAMLSTLARPQELAYMIRHADIETLIAADAYLGRDYVADLAEALPALAEAAPGAPLRLLAAPFLRRIRIFGSARPAWSSGGRDDLIAQGAGIDPALLRAAEDQVVPADPALLIYTSGTTADPKAVVHSQGAIARQAWGMSRYMAYAPGDRLMTTMPFFWVGGLCTSMLAANLNGAAIVCPERPGAAGMMAALDAHRVTHAALWPQQLAELAAQPGFGDVRERLRPNSAQQLGLFGLATPERTPNSLGMTETFGPHSMERFGPPLPADRTRSFGRAVGAIERRIVDPATGATLPPGATGELLLRGGAMMLGFHRREHADTFDAEGFYHTGDLCRMSDDGHLFFEGRRDDMVKVAGANVSPREVEQQLLAHPAVHEAIVLGVADGGGGHRLAGVVVPSGQGDVDETQLVAWLRGRLAGYKVPRRLAVLAAGAIPRTASHKVNLPALRALLGELLPG